MKLNFREARLSDVPILVEMLADDELGALREDSSLPLNQKYIEAFKNIAIDSNNQLIVVDIEDKIIGTLQLTYIPYLTHMGSWRCLIEGVRIHKDHRGKGYGKRFFEWAIVQANSKDCEILQLTSDKQRPVALRFYKELGFQASHEGFKMILK